MSPHVSSYIITATCAGPSAKPTKSDSVNLAGIVFETYPFQESCLLIRVFVKIFSNRDLFQSKRDQNGGSAAISCHVGKI